MPCYDDRSDLNSSEGYKLHHERLLKEFTHNSPVAEILCDTLTTLEECNKQIPKSARKWWEDHKARDQNKTKAKNAIREKEQARKAALAKLSPKERKLLGV